GWLKSVVLEPWARRKERDDIRIEPSHRSAPIADPLGKVRCDRLPSHRAAAKKSLGPRPGRASGEIDMLPVPGILLTEKFEHGGIRIFHVSHLAPGHALDGTPLRALAGTGAYQQRHQAYADEL